MFPAPDRTARDVAYLTLALATSVLAFGVWVAAVTVTLSLAVFVIGLPIAIGSAIALRWTAELDRRNAALVFGRPVRGHYRDHRSHSLFGRVGATLGDPQTWRDLAWLITHSVVGFAFGVIAVSLIGSVAALATLPAWYWAPSEGLDMGLWHADTLPLAVATAFLAVPLAWVTAWVVRGFARFHASLAVELLGR